MTDDTKQNPNQNKETFREGPNSSAPSGEQSFPFIPSGGPIKIVDARPTENQAPTYQPATSQTPSEPLPVSSMVTTTGDVSTSLERVTAQLATQSVTNPEENLSQSLGRPSTPTISEDPPSLEVTSYNPDTPGGIAQLRVQRKLALGQDSDKKAA